jgi:hypothetical protein
LLPRPGQLSEAVEAYLYLMRNDLRQLAALLPATFCGQSTPRSLEQLNPGCHLPSYSRAVLARL